MAAKTMRFRGVTIRASAGDGRGWLWVLLAVVVLLPGMVGAAAYAVATVLMVLLVVMPAVFLAGLAATVAATILGNRHIERDTEFVRRKLAVDLAVEQAGLPPAPPRTVPGRSERVRSAIEVPSGLVDLDELVARRRGR
jgi:hypothetical protein